MPKHLRRTGLFAAVAVLAQTGNAHAHTMVVPYTLPVPLWLYIFTCGATLVLTFAVLAMQSARAPKAATPDRPAWYDRQVTVELGAVARIGWPILKTGAFLLLALTIFNGFLGPQDPNANSAIALFWVVYALLYTYSVPVLGNTFEIVNPWRTLCAIIPARRREHGYVRYPDRLSYWPAFILYIGYIWFELLVLPRPQYLASALLGYSIFTLIGASVFGTRVWFEKVEFFSVFFRILGRLAPLAYSTDTPSRVTIRWPLSGTIRHVPASTAQLMFILFMLASTTYDGLSDTSLWNRLYWTNAMALTQPLFGDDLGLAQRLLVPGFEIYRRAGLVLAPFFYLAIYLATIKLTSIAAGKTHSVSGLMRSFSMSLIPIAIVYHFAHYFLYLLVSLIQVPYIATDPFLQGWNLLALPVAPLAPLADMAVVWHVELALILAGHLASVWIAHEIALRVFGRSGRTAWVEVPLLVLMVAYTFFGLFVLSLPLALH